MDRRPGPYLGRLEIPAADPVRAGRFFARVFGWRTRAVDSPGAPYLDLHDGRSGERTGAAAGLATPGTLGTAQPLPVIHIENEPLVGVLERIAEAGGTIDLAPRKIAGHGTFARFRDPEGNLFGLWQPGS
ncbi:MAG TPA: VOC family protein [Thermoanaerobaculia bacterium]|nr:VOC family protein [Thermoanaerobaculia bacterium]